MKALTYTLLILAMVAFGFSVYRLTGVLKTDSGAAVRPTSTSAAALTGTMYVAQQGALYRFKGGAFTQITDEAGWTQPSVSPDGSQLVAVMRHQNYSDVYLLGSSGRIIRRLTHNDARAIESKHWAFLPRFGADRATIFYSYDAKDPFATYRVDLGIFALPDDGSGAVVQWTVPNEYTGGDVDPLPLRDGALVYTRYSIDENSQVHSQVWFTSSPGQTGRALTPPEQNCAQPSVSPDQKTLAMICRHDQLQSTDLVVAQLDEADVTIGPESVLVQAQLAAAPVFAPDGQTIAFLAPVRPGQVFQLWTVPAAASSPSAARPITQNLGLDSSAPPAWVK